jgi:hypothetical protein
MTEEPEIFRQQAAGKDGLPFFFSGCVHGRISALLFLIDTPLCAFTSPDREA